MKKLLVMMAIALLIVGCNSDTTVIEVEGESNSSLRAKSSTAINCDDILKINIQGKEANVTIGEDNYFASGDLFIDYYIYADCEDENITDINESEVE